MLHTQNQLNDLCFCFEQPVCYPPAMGHNYSKQQRTRGILTATSADYPDWPMYVERCEPVCSRTAFTLCFRQEAWNSFATDLMQQTSAYDENAYFGRQAR